MNFARSITSLAQSMLYEHFTSSEITFLAPAMPNNTVYTFILMQVVMLSEHKTNSIVFRRVYRTEEESLGLRNLIQLQAYYQTLGSLVFTAYGSPQLGSCVCVSVSKKPSTFNLIVHMSVQMQTVANIKFSRYLAYTIFYGVSWVGKTVHMKCELREQVYIIYIG